MKTRQRFRSRHPTVFARLEGLARNLWWTWNSEPRRLFAALDPVAWEATNHNPIAVLDGLSPERRQALAADKVFLDHLRFCERALAEYLNGTTWFDRTATPAQRKMLVAYFCMEFATHESMPQYAGGLGVLAGDHLKSASDLGVPLVGVGLLYQHGYYRQEFDRQGRTRALYPTYDFRHWPITNTRAAIDIKIGKRTVLAKIWGMHVGRVDLFLLDTNVPENHPEDRRLTGRLYGGDLEYRLRQEILLGIGGVRMLEFLTLKPTRYHLNEGHAAFCVLDRLNTLLDRGGKFIPSAKKVQRGTVFTTHTPVAAGHDRFPEELMRKYFYDHVRHYPQGFERLMALGREDSDAAGSDFCMTALALRLSGRCNGVSKLHGDVSRHMWMKALGASRPDDVPIGHVTNGVHSQTWLAPEMAALYDKYLKPRWNGAGPQDNWWKRADRIPPDEIWAMRSLLRRRLVQFVRERLTQQAIRQLASVPDVAAAGSVFDESALTIGFARRFATYKRAPLIFHEPKRLARILNDPVRPVQIVFSGKAHPRDRDGQKYAQAVYRFAHRPEFRSRVALIENYDMHVGRMLTSGCDVWLNTPLRPQEASGTSGMKPPLHGGINCSILDGWWPEAYNRRNGWAIGTEPRNSFRGRPAMKTRAQQDRYDADSLYDLLENQIVPLFYKRDRADVPRRWVRMMIESMKTVCGPFSGHRMVSEYVTEYYLPALEKK